MNIIKAGINFYRNTKKEGRGVEQQLDIIKVIAAIAFLLSIGSLLFSIVAMVSYYGFNNDLTDTEKVESQIYQYPTKGTPEVSDLLVMSDESDSHAVKTATVGSLPVPISILNVIDAKQDANANLDDLSDGSLTGSLVGTGIDADNITTGEIADARIPAGIARDSELGGGFTEYIRSELDDTATPHVLIAAEVQNTVLNNYHPSGSNSGYQLPTPAAGYGFIGFVGAAYTVEYAPASGEYLILNNVALSVDEKIVNTSLNVGERFAGIATRVNGAYQWMIYSSDAGWVEETP